MRWGLLLAARSELDAWRYQPYSLATSQPDIPELAGDLCDAHFFRCRLVKTATLSLRPTFFTSFFFLCGSM